MVESKFVILQMIPHTLFIEWDFGHYSWHCSLAIVKLLFTSRWTVHVYGNVHIYSTIHTTSFFSLNVHF